jgi:hypothetical protein
MRLRKPVPIDREVRVISRIVSDGKRSFEGTGEILLEDGSVAIEGKGKYLKMDIGKIADFDHREQEWGIVESPDDPDSITLP